MSLALAQAELGKNLGEVPVGAVIISGEKTLAAAHNRMKSTSNPLAHAEMEAISQAVAKRGAFLNDCDIYVTLEPCLMCAAAISRAKLRAIYFGAYDTRQGALTRSNLYEEANLNHVPRVVGGVMEKECAAPLKKLFAARRSG